MTGHVGTSVLDALRRGASRASSENLPSRTLAVLPTHSAVDALAGADADGVYTLAIVARATQPTPAPIRMAVLSVEYGAIYLLDEGDVGREVRVTVLRCNSMDHEIRELFGSFCESVLAVLPASPTEKDVAVELNRWLGLFWRLQAPPRTDVVGLIGELTFLRVAPKRSPWIHGWHGDPSSTIDFVLTKPHVEVEVKATQSATRKHTISYGQAFGAGNRFFASVIVDLRDSGGTIADFAREIADRLAPENVQRLWHLVASGCGSAYAGMMSERFVWKTSIDSLRFYRQEEIPRPELTHPLPIGVSGLRFTSDFTNSPSISVDEFFEISIAPH
ncbi:PD-(D/E)XK motif protein [Isoptericola sp. NPDC055881]